MADICPNRRTPAPNSAKMLGTGVAQDGRRACAGCRTSLWRPACGSASHSSPSRSPRSWHQLIRGPALDPARHDPRPCGHRAACQPWRGEGVARAPRPGPRHHRRGSRLGRRRHGLRRDRGQGSDPDPGLQRRPELRCPRGTLHHRPRRCDWLRRDLVRPRGHRAVRHPDAALVPGRGCRGPAGCLVPADGGRRARLLPSTRHVAAEASMLLRRLHELADTLDTGFDAPASAEMALQDLGCPHAVCPQRHPRGLRRRPCGPARHPRRRPHALAGPDGAQLRAVERLAGRHPHPDGVGRGPGRPLAHRRPAAGRDGQPPGAARGGPARW